MISLNTPISKHRLSPWLVIALLLILATTLPVNGVAATDILVVTSSNAKPYRQAAVGLQERLDREGRTFVVHQLENMASVPLKNAPGSSSLYVAVGTPAASWLDQHLPSDAPIGFCLASAPDRWKRSERPSYGVSSEIPVKNQFSVIAEALPHTRRIGMLYHMGSAGHKRVGVIRQALPHGWSIEAIAVDHHTSFADALAALLDRDVDLIWTELDPKTYQPSTVRSLLLAALRRGVPVFGYSTGCVQAGSVLGVGIDPNEQGQQLAELILRLLQRGQATRIPRTLREPATPRHFVAINSLVADKLAIHFPDSFTARARVIVGEP